MGPLNQKIRKFLFGFRTKVTAAAVLALLFVAVLSNFFVTRSSLDSQFQQLRQQLRIFAQVAALSVDGDALLKIPMNREGVQTPEFRGVSDQLGRVKAVDSSIKYIYILRPADKPGVWKFIVDLDPELKRSGRKDVTAYPGDDYFVGRFPEMVAGLNGPAADRQLTSDEWGTTLSGYAPVRDGRGRVAGVLGVDMDARDVRLAQRNIRRAAFWVFLAGVFLSTVLGIYLSGRMTVRIRRLIEGTRRLSDGELEYRVRVGGNDEIGELSESFDRMAAALHESRKNLAEYYIRTVQSLVRMLEAKDKYTQGHSERVGVYAQRVALKMGYSKEQADLVRVAGELHDIGKLAVHEHILTKPGPLNDEEWEIIRKHPVIGAEALQPACFDEIIMASIYSHHERHDGSGYPLKMKGDQINVFAQMIAVSDAYDAMTTTRPYRKAIDRKAAIEEIRAHSGTQFNPVVAEAFIRVLQEE